MPLTRNSRPATRSHAGRAAALPAARVGRLAGVSAEGRPLVVCDGLIAAPTEALLAAAPPEPLETAVGRDVVLLFQDGDPARPIVTGWVETATPSVREVRVDGKRLRLSAETELVLSCGEASITLTADGRVLIRGRGVLSHAKEQNRIRGGQVKIN